MVNKQEKRNIELQKISSEKLPSKFALLSVAALVGAYIVKGQIIQGIV